MTSTFSKPIKAVAVTAVLAFSAAQAHADDVRLKIAGTTPTAHFGHEILVNMAKEIEDAGVGLKVRYFPAGQLGTGEELFADAKNGNIDIVHAYVYPQADKRLEIGMLPFAVTTIDELRATWGDIDSEFNQIISEILEDHGLKLLANVGEGLIGMIGTKQPGDVTGFGDKDMNIRVWSSRVVKKTMEALGYRTTTMAWAEVFPAVQAGTIDGAICCTAEWAYSTFAKSDVGNVFIPYNAFIEGQQIYMNKATWDKLTPEQQEVLQEATAKAARAIIDESWGRSQDFIAKLREKDWEVIELSEEQRAAIQAKVQAEVWPEIGDIVGQDLLDRMTAQN